MHAKVGRILPGVSKGHEMNEFDLSAHVRAELPWTGSTRYRNKPNEGSDSLKYRGWVLVDCNGWRWAFKGSSRIRICRDRGVGHNEAISEFRRKVDEHERGQDD